MDIRAVGVANPFTSRTSMDAISVTHAAVWYLLHRQRTDYIAIFYSLTDEGIQIHEALTFALAQRGMKWKSFPFANFKFPERFPEREIDGAIAAVKGSGYRTIVTILEGVEAEYVVNMADQGTEAA